MTRALSNDNTFAQFRFKKIYTKIVNRITLRLVTPEMIEYSCDSNSDKS